MVGKLFDSSLLIVISLCIGIAARGYAATSNPDYVFLIAFAAPVALSLAITNSKR